MSEFNREIGSLITRLDRTKKKSMSETLSRYGMKGGQHLILIYLEHRPGASQDDIANWFVMDKGNVARHAAKLESMGYIRREIDPENRRSYRLYLEEGGRKVMEEIHKAHEQWTLSLSGSLTEEEQEQVVKLMQKMADPFYSVQN